MMDSETLYYEWDFGEATDCPDCAAFSKRSHVIEVEITGFEGGAWLVVDAEAVDVRPGKIVIWRIGESDDSIFDTTE